MLAYLSASNADGGQIIITGATPRGELDKLIASVEAEVTDIGEDRLLQEDVGDDPMDVT